MTYLSILWSVAAAAAVLLALIHALVWVEDRREHASLASAAGAMALAVHAITQLGMLHATSPQERGEWVWWAHASLVVIVSGAFLLLLYLSLRRPPRIHRVALLVAGAVLATAILAIVTTHVLTSRTVVLSTLLLPPLLLVLTAMAIKVGRDLLSASRLASELHESEQHAELAANSVNELHGKLAHAGRVTMLGQLASSLAHEISQPLSAIQHNAETARLLLARDPVDLQELRAIIGDLLRDDQRAVEVVHCLRNWLKQGRMRREAIVLHELTRDVIALAGPAAAAKHVMLDFAVPCTLPPVFGDRVHLSQVLLNLVMNAIDAVVEARDANPGVRIEACIAANRFCEMSVTDTGPGIPSDQIDRIFEPFVTAKTEGLGVGLSISRTIVEAHGGKLWAENAARGGATFRFTVPTQQRGGVVCPS